jgi:hypothetical protein
MVGNVCEYAIVIHNNKEHSTRLRARNDSTLEINPHKDNK